MKLRFQLFNDDFVVIKHKRLVLQLLCKILNLQKELNLYTGSQDLHRCSFGFIMALFFSIPWSAFLDVNK